MANENYKVNRPPLIVPDDNLEDSELNLFDPDNPDIVLFDSIDAEQIKLSGSKLHYYKYLQSDDYDEVYMESRVKPIMKDPMLVHGHYEPQAMSENLTQFGIELQNDQLFIFNKTYIENRLGRTPIPGDVIKPYFQNQRYEIFQVVEDSFESYGVYHLTCSAKLLRDNDKIQSEPLLDTNDTLGGYAG